MEARLGGAKWDPEHIRYLSHLEVCTESETQDPLVISRESTERS
jgi:hypothetical protein